MQASPKSRRRPFLWMLSLALVVLAAIAISRIIGLRTEIVETETRELQSEVADLVATWEDQFVRVLDEWLEDAASDTASGRAYQEALRKKQSWFDGLFLWVPPPVVTVKGKPQLVRGTLLFPSYPPSEDGRRLRLHPCLRGARALSRSGDADPEAMAAEYLSGCAEEKLQVRLVAATEAATLYTRLARYQQALDALDGVGLPEGLPLRAGIEMGIDPFRLVTHRTQRARLMLALGRHEEALDLYYETGAQIATLDAPHAQGLLEQVRWPIMAELREHSRGKDAERLAVLLSRAERRMLAWREIENRVLPQSRASVSSAPRFIYDQYADTPFLLYYGLKDDGAVGVALVLDQPLLLSAFLKHMHRYSDHIVVTDANGDWVAGSRGGGSIVVQVPFNRSLTHLRVGVRADAIAERVDRFGNQWLTPLVVTIVCVLLGLAGLTAQIRASDRQAQLLTRQREFTARVTHELKTPLAGVRVMAENIETGAFKDRRHLRNMAERIIDEVDRLTERVDEILAFSGRRRPLTIGPFDPEESILEAIDRWGPRLAQAGVKLEADLHPTDAVSGDPASIRDAVGCLLDNALKYRDPDKAESRVILTLQQDGSHIVIEVTDNGIGIPLERRKDVFERFVRVEGPNRGMAGGHGLGLAQVAQIAREHRATVRISDGLDGGVRFTLRLPALRHAATA